MIPFRFFPFLQPNGFLWHKHTGLLLRSGLDYIDYYFWLSCLPSCASAKTCCFNHNDRNKSHLYWLSVMNPHSFHGNQSFIAVGLILAVIMWPTCDVSAADKQLTGLVLTEKTLRMDSMLPSCQQTGYVYSSYYNTRNTACNVLYIPDRHVKDK